jgi:hypothetical protein
LAHWDAVAALAVALFEVVPLTVNLLAALAECVVVSRFSTQEITIKDPRYAAQTWKGDEMTDQLIVRRTILGSSLNVLAGGLLKPTRTAKDEEPNK